MIYWWCFVFEVGIQIVGGVQLWGESGWCLNSRKNKNQNETVFIPQMNVFTYSQKIYTILFLKCKYHSVKNSYKTWIFSGFQKVIISLVISFKKSAKSVKKLQNTVVKTTKNLFFSKNEKKVKIEIFKFCYKSIT